MTERFATLRQELGDEFAGTRLKMEEMSSAFAASEAQLKDLLQEASDQQIAMKIKATQSLSDSKMQGEALKGLISQSSDIQAKQATQVRDVVEGLHLSTRDRFNSVEGKLTLTESALHSIHDKLVGYDSLIAGQRQGKGAGTADGRVYPEVRSLIHEKDIKMPSFPEKPESPEIFRRWWKDVGEYCERFKTFPNCSFLFKKLRGYNDALDEGPAVTTLFAKLDDDLPSDQTMAWEIWIAEKELYYAVKFVFKREVPRTSREG